MTRPIIQGTMTSEVLQNNVEATYITVETVSFYGVKAEPERVTVNSQDAEFTYRANQVRKSGDTCALTGWGYQIYSEPIRWEDPNFVTEHTIRANQVREPWLSGSVGRAKFPFQINALNFNVSLNLPIV